jgi:hypothetical protein
MRTVVVFDRAALLKDGRVESTMRERLFGVVVADDVEGLFRSSCVSGAGRDVLDEDRLSSSL